MKMAAPSRHFVSVVTAVRDDGSAEMLWRGTVQEWILGSSPRMTKSQCSRSTGQSFGSTEKILTAPASERQSKASSPRGIAVYQ